MAQELTLNIDWDTVRGVDLRVYPLPGREHPTTSLEVEGVPTVSPVEGSDETRKFDVTVEFHPGPFGLDDASFVEYLDTFEDANVSQETMARKIRTDICRALDLDDAFVEVHRNSPAHKRTRIGKP